MMGSMKIQNAVKKRFGFFAGDSLTKKASLNAFAVALDYAARLIVVFLVTPLLVVGLGKFLFGAWQILNRLMSYITPSSGRPTQALKWTIAKDQSSTDYEQKQKSVGSAFIVWVVFLPLMIVLGAVLVWMVPVWLKTPPELFFPVRLGVGILAANLAITSLAEIPISVLQGENLGYKRMGLSTATVFLSGALVWLALYLKTGIAGVAAATLITTLVSGAIFLKAVRRFTPWFKISLPALRETRQFFGLSFWFMGWNLVMNLMTASDVVILGFLNSAEAVTDYSLSKYAPETLISLIAMTNFGITPGLGGILGSGQLKKAAHIRGEMMTLTWLVSTALGATILAWNRTFLDLWVGTGHYVGRLSAFLITLVVVQFVLIRSDAGIIDLSLDLRRKVVIGFLSSIVAIAAAALMVGYFKWGVVGLCLGLICGRLMLTLGYPSIVGRILEKGLLSQLRSCLRPALVTFFLCGIASWLDGYIHFGGRSGLSGWIRLVWMAGLTAGLFVAAAFYLGLSGRQRRTILRRLRAVNSPAA
jgi:O-antigen/teichoic acid export membrane protein